MKSRVSAEQILAARAAGWSYNQISAQFGVSARRISQVVDPERYLRNQERLVRRKLRAFLRAKGKQATKPGRGFETRASCGSLVVKTAV